MCQQLAVAVNISRRVSVAVCDRIAAPILVGVFRPMILLPAAALTGWAPQQLEMVLLHELAHVRRYDNLVNLLQRVVESLLFFQPMVWIVSGWVRREREYGCDELVVAAPISRTPTRKCSWLWRRTFPMQHHAVRRWGSYTAACPWPSGPLILGFAAFSRRRNSPCRFPERQSV